MFAQIDPGIINIDLKHPGIRKLEKVFKFIKKMNIGIEYSLDYKATWHEIEIHILLDEYTNVYVENNINIEREINPAEKYSITIMRDNDGFVYILFKYNDHHIHIYFFGRVKICINGNKITISIIPKSKVYVK